MRTFKIFWDRLHNGVVPVASCDNVATAQKFCHGICADTKSNLRIEGQGRIIKFISTNLAYGRHVVVREEVREA